MVATSIGNPWPISDPADPATISPFAPEDCNEGTAAEMRYGIEESEALSEDAVVASFFSGENAEKNRTVYRSSCSSGTGLLFWVQGLQTLLLSDARSEDLWMKNSMEELPFLFQPPVTILCASENYIN